MVETILSQSHMGHRARVQKAGTLLWLTNLIHVHLNERYLGNIKKKN